VALVRGFAPNLSTPTVEAEARALLPLFRAESSLESMNMIYSRKTGPRRWRLQMSIRNQMEDPFRDVKRKPGQIGRRLKPSERVEFAPIDVFEIRSRFDQTQQEFADMLGISVETLRNWERGRRHPQGPARSLLRIADSDPAVVARVLTRSRAYWKPEEEEARSAHVERLLKRRTETRAAKVEADKDAAERLESETGDPTGDKGHFNLDWLYRD
jgi:putative transcriptional regulator